MIWHSSLKMSPSDFVLVVMSQCHCSDNLIFVSIDVKMVTSLNF